MTLGLALGRGGPHCRSGYIAANGLNDCWYVGTPKSLVNCVVSPTGIQGLPTPSGMGNTINFEASMSPKSLGQCLFVPGGITSPQAAKHSKSVLAFGSRIASSKGRQSSAFARPGQHFQKRRSSKITQLEELHRQCNARATPEPPEIGAMKETSKSVSPCERKRPPPLSDNLLSDDAATETILPEYSLPMASPRPTLPTLLLGANSCSPTSIQCTSPLQRTITPKCISPQRRVSQNTLDALEFVGALRSPPNIAARQTVMNSFVKITQQQIQQRSNRRRGAGHEIGLHGVVPTNKFGSMVKSIVHRVRSQPPQGSTTGPKTLRGALFSTVSPDAEKRRQCEDWHKWLNNWGVCKPGSSVVQPIQPFAQRQEWAKAACSAQKVMQYAISPSGTSMLGKTMELEEVVARERGMIHVRSSLHSEGSAEVLHDDWLLSRSSSPSIFGNSGSTPLLEGSDVSLSPLAQAKTKMAWGMS